MPVFSQCCDIVINIVIETNVVILDFLSARFIHPDALLPFYLFLTWVRI